VRKIHSLLSPLATARVILFLAGVCVILVMGVFPLATGRLAELSGGVRLIDMEIGYTPSRAFQMVAAYGEQGRPLYILTTLAADLVFPLAYGLLFALLIVVTYRRAFPASRLVRFLVLFPFAAAGFDLLENACIVILLASHPAQWTWVAQLAGLFTLVKWSFVIMSVVLVSVGAAGVIAAAIPARQKK
jgi:hypothetical protein